MFDADKTRMIGLPYSEKKYDNMLSRFHPIPERDGLTDGQTDLLYKYRARYKLDQPRSSAIAKNSSDFYP